MKILKPILVILLFLCLKSGNAQIETVNNAQRGDTCVPASVDDYNRLIKYFISEKQETKQLFKFDLIQYALFRPNIAYERKIKNNLNAEFSFLFGYDKYNGNFEIWTSQYYLLAPTFDVKYYHNIKQRKNRGKNTNGFSGNFISVGLGTYFFKYSSFAFDENLDGKLVRGIYRLEYEENEHLQYNDSHTDEKTASEVVWRNKKYEPNESIVFVRMGYGIQRRIGNVGYVATDFNFGVGTNYNGEKNNYTRIYLMPEFSIKAGFAISSFKKK